MASAKAMTADVHRIASVMDELTQKLTALSFVNHQVRSRSPNRQSLTLASIPRRRTSDF